MMQQSPMELPNEPQKLDNSTIDQIILHERSSLHFTNTFAGDFRELHSPPMRQRGSIAGSVGLRVILRTDNILIAQKA